jgi:hypothetical protein
MPWWRPKTRCVVDPVNQLYLIARGIAVECEDELEVSQTVARQERVYKTDEGLFTLSKSPL